MPVIVILGGEPPVQRSRVTLPLNAQVGGRRTALTLYATTQAIRQRTALSLSITTLDLTAPDQLPPPKLTGDVQHGTALAYLITHGGLPAEAKDYSIGTQNGMPTLQATLRGRVDVTGTLSLVATATPLAGGPLYAAAYGPFNHLRSTYTQTQTGWVTKISSADTTEKDATALQLPLPEYLPWEKEKDLTALQTAQKARDDALLALTLKDVKCKDKVPVDRRRVLVHSLIWWALGQLPASLPYLVLAPLPYPGDFFWASQDTAAGYFGGVLNGVSYQTKGKKALDVVRDILGRAGWQVTLRGGMVLIGPPAALLTTGGAALEVNVPMEMLTERSEELVNVNAGASNDPQAPSGSFDLPRQITVHLATAKKYLPPLPDEDQITTFELARDMVLAGGSSVVSPDANGIERTESVTTWTKTKVGGLLVSEATMTNGVVPDVQIDFLFKTVKLESWQLREDKQTTYGYSDPIYPKAQTSTATITQSYIAYLKAVRETERITALTTWHPKGWLQQKITVKISVQSFGFTLGTGPSGPQLFPYAQTQQETETETWIPTRPGWWHHTVTRYRTRVFPVYEDADSATLIGGGTTETVTDEETDQGPPRAPEGECPVDEPVGFPYDAPNDAVKFTGGRGDATEVDIPWATKLPVGIFDSLYPQARPKRKLTYVCAVPPTVKFGGPVGTFSASGSNGKFSATITVEEEA